MILIGSALLLATGLLVLLWQAIAIAFSLLKIAYYLAKGAVYLVVLVVCVVCLAVQHALALVRWLAGKPEPAEPEPVVTLDFYADADAEDVPTIELLPPAGFRRLRG
jgi:hypothetical protein